MWRLFITEQIGIIQVIIIKVWPFQIGKLKQFVRTK